MTESFRYPDNRDWRKEYALREFEKAMAKNTRITPKWGIIIEDSMFCGERIDYDYEVYTVQIPIR